MNETSNGNPLKKFNLMLISSSFLILAALILVTKCYVYQLYV